MRVLNNLSADEIIAKLDLAPHPEGGYFRETFRSDIVQDGRAAGTAIYYLLKAGERSHWHRVDADEIWHWYGGDALVLLLSEDEKKVEKQLLGPDILDGQSPQVVVPKGVWQSAQAGIGWTLVGCTVAPAFEFSGFEMAEDGWQPE